MSEEIKFDVNNGVSLEYSCDVKEEFQDVPEYISESAITDGININNTEMNEYIRKDKIGKYEMPFVELVKTDLPSLEVNDTVSNNVKRENGICPSDIETIFCNELLSCNHCNEVYQDYCTKCKVLVHILNEKPSHNTYDRARELPKYMLETRDSIGHLGIFSLKVIPENVRFGPFTGLNSTGLPLRIKGGRFVVSDDKLQHLNWMQFINPARNIYEQNLLPFQCEDKLYYCSTRRIQGGEELLLYFGKEYEDNLLKNVEMNFVPITKDIGHVFACIFCCLGFRSKEYLAEHKAVHHSETKEMFSVEELAQCPFCKIYLEAKEYFEHHMDYCSETNDRFSVPSAPKVYDAEITRRLPLRSNAERWKRRIYKCTQCKFRTIYKADFRHHTNEHCQVKKYICGICHRKYTVKESLKVHMKTKHLGEKKYKCAGCEYKTNYKSRLQRHINAKHLKQNHYECAECEFKTSYKANLQAHIKTKHLKENRYKCTDCEYKTYYKSSFEEHVKAKHLKEKDYKCAECDFKTNNKSYLKRHVKVKHLKENDYKCTECVFTTNYKSDLKVHVNAKHLKETDYECTECEYKTNYKKSLRVHINAKHLKGNGYKCTECEFTTSYKANLQLHMKAKHLKEYDYKCTECEFKTNYKACLERHIKVKHLKENDYKRTECKFNITNHQADLNQHIKRKHLKENDYKCPECEFKTHYKSSLQIHIKVKHLKENDYKCTECEYRTNYKINFQAHIKAKHLQENDYKCTECEFKTNYKASLERHIKAKHLKESDYSHIKIIHKIEIT